MKCLSRKMASIWFVTRMLHEWLERMERGEDDGNSVEDPKKHWVNRYWGELYDDL